MATLEMILNEAHTAVLATVDEKGRPHLRWMTPALIGGREGAVCAVTSPGCHKTRQLEKHPEVEWLFQTPLLDTVVMARGKINVLDNPSILAEVLESLGPYMHSLWRLRQMLRIRRIEEKAGAMYGLRKIGGFCHLYIGQEAVAVGAIAALDLSRDYVLTAYRDHGHALACGMDPNALMAELYGKATGCSRGKGGSMHLFDPGRHTLGGNGIVGAHIPVATGVALKLKYRQEDGVVLCFFGDGAIHQGAFHESLNLAKIWRLPIVYICENNQYGMGTDFRRVSAVTDLSLMGASYDIPR